MARYDWPGSPPPTGEDRFIERNQHVQRLWTNIADGLLREAQTGFYGALAALAESAVTEAELDRKRWLPIGPSAILGGHASGRPRVTGRIRDLKRSPDGSRVYAASANGGVWFSGDGGQSWSPLGGMATTPDRDARGRSGNSLVIGCLLVDFGANADTDIVYAGTGEPVRNHYGDEDEDALPGGKSGGIGILRLMRPLSQAIADPTGNPWQREAPNLTGAGIYRLALDPSSNRNDPQTERLVAATTFGLFRRSGPFTRDAEWQRVAVPPFDVQNTDRVFATDVAWVPAATAPAAAPARLFVGLVNLGKTNKDSAVYVSEAGIAGPFDKIDLPGYLRRRRIALAPVLPLRASPDRHPQVIYVLSGRYMNPRLWRIDVRQARRVTNLPPTLFGDDEDSDQSWYDMAVAVDPSAERRVFLGGKIVDGNAALFRCDLTGTAAADDFAADFDPDNDDTPSDDITFVGEGVHADVHAIHVSEDGRQVWVGCDGGVFSSSRLGARLSFEPRNTGLAVAQCGFVASNPGHPGPVVSGLQDNGVIRRAGDTVWRRESWSADGGGVAFHPDANRPAFFVGQVKKTNWRGNEGSHFDPPVQRAAFRFRRYEFERKRSLFYSGAAAAPGAVAGRGRLAIGSFRLWLTENWDPLAPAGNSMSWRTLPSATDPLADASPNKDRDELDKSAGEIVTVKWLDPGTLSGTTFRGSKLLVLYERAIALIYQVDGVDKWKRDILTGDEKESKRLTKDSDIPENGAPSDKLPWLGAWSDLALHRATKPGDASFKGSFYVATTGHSKLTNTGFSQSARMDTLWWYDGKGKFFPTGLRNEGSKAPAFAVICDPEEPDHVFVGTAMGVWRGIFTQIGDAAPAWTWTMFSIGLPEVVVQDLSFHWNPTAPNGGLKLLRAATEARGIWEVDLSANPSSINKSFLRVHPLDTRHILPTNLVNLTDVTAAPPNHPRCLSPDIAIIDGLAAGVSPTEADFVALPRNAETDVGPVGSRFRVQQVTIGRHAAHVLAHYRHSNPLPAADCKLILLKRRLTAAEGDGGGIALSAAWKTAVVNLLVNGQNVTLDDRWKNVSASEASNPTNNAVTATAAIRSPAGAIDARMPRAATFQLELTGTSFGQRYLLLALLTTSRDPLQAAELGGATVADIVLNSRHVCARTLQVASESTVFGHVLFEHLDPATNTIVTETIPATPAVLANNFYSAERAGTVTHGPLQTALDGVINEPAFKKFRADIAVALVDLSGADKFAPKYAGFNDRTNFYAASTGKIPGMLAAYQLRADARDALANTPGIANFAALEAEMRRRWTQAGIALPHHPDFANVLEWKAGTPPTVEIASELLGRFRRISVGNENGSTAIVLMKFPYIASTMLAHGLFSPLDRTGLWCRSAYGPIVYDGQNMSISDWPDRENPFPGTPSNSVSAAQIAHFMTLLAQRRVIDEDTSDLLLRHLDTGGCFSPEVEPIGFGLNGLGDVAAKCGYFGDVSHDPIYFKATAGPREFVCVLLTKNNKRTVANALYTRLLTLLP